MEIKNKLTVTRREGEEDNGGRKGGGSSRTVYKGPVDKPKEGGLNVGMGVGRAGGE